MANAMVFPDTVEEFMEDYKVIDSDHVYSNGTEYVPIFRMKQWFEHLKGKPKTHADSIRSMTDEELLQLLLDQQCSVCDWQGDCDDDETPDASEQCKREISEWLKQECDT